ncbi:MAG: cysteine desulfurase family protein [bacterium]|nr:cysteine desulfurase family protein [bacterium]
MSPVRKKRPAYRRGRIFLDYASATPVLPEVKRAMDKYWSRDFYNPSAIYREGLLIKEEIGKNRTRIARALGISSSGVIFTASGTESDNLAILGTFEKGLETFEKPHIIISAIEHPAIVAAAAEVVRRGGEISILEVDKEGLVSVEVLKKLLKENTFLVSVGLANNEIGTIQPLSQIGRLLREYRKDHDNLYPYLHTDASQAPNYLNIGIESLQADLLTLDGSKIYGPKGVGVLAVRRGVKIHPIIFGGEQERGRRAGTLNPALVSGFALSLEIALRDRKKESERLETLRKYFVEFITKRQPKIVINGSSRNHLPNIISISLSGTLSEFILLKLDREGVMVSVGSACSLDERVSGSSVITALGKTDLAEATLRFSFGRFTTSSDIRRAVEIFCLEVSRQNRRSETKN